MKRSLPQQVRAVTFTHLSDVAHSLIFASCHHNTPGLNMVSKRFFRVISERGEWFRIAHENFAALALDERYKSSDVIRSLLGSFELLKNSELFEKMSVAKDVRYKRFINYVGLLLNSKIAGIIERHALGDYGLTNIQESITTYIKSVYDNPLSTRNFHRLDFYVNFREEGHLYTLIRPVYDPVTGKIMPVTVLSKSDEENGGGVASKQRVTSNTTFIHTLYPHFDENRKAAELVASAANAKSVEENKYFGKTVEQVLASWQLARENGTLRHQNLEKYYIGKPFVDETPEFKLFKALEADHITGKLIPYRSECLINSDTLMISGGVDMLYERVGDENFFNNTPVYKETPASKKKIVEMYDWKFCINVIDYNTWADDNSGIVPCTQHSPNCNGIMYLIQLCIYKYILEERYDIIVAAMYLAILHPEQKTYIRREIKWDEHTKKFIAGIIQHRLDTIKKPHGDVS